MARAKSVPPLSSVPPGDLSVRPVRVFVVGAGVVGFATGAGCAGLGHEVTFVDTSVSRVRELRSQGWDARIELDLAGEGPAIIFLTLPTPNLGDRYDLSAFAAGTAAVGRSLGAATTRGHLVVVRSTVPPGTSDGLLTALLAEHSGKTVGVEFLVASSPEFLRAVSAVEDFRHPWMTVIGSRSPEAIGRLRELFAAFGGELRTFDDPSSAEFVKCAHNIFNATKISFWNEMWRVAQRLGVELDPIAATVAASAEGSINPRYGIRGGTPYGGMCLPKDTRGFLGFAADLELDMPLLRSVVEVNDQMSAPEAGEVEDLVVHGAGQV